MHLAGISSPSCSSQSPWHAASSYKHQPGSSAGVGMASEGSCTAVRAGDGPTPIVTADGVRSSSSAAEQVCSKQCCWHITLLRSLPQFLLRVTVAHLCRTSEHCCVSCLPPCHPSSSPCCLKVVPALLLTSSKVLFILMAYTEGFAALMVQVMPSDNSFVASQPRCTEKRFPLVCRAAICSAAGENSFRCQTYSVYFPSAQVPKDYPAAQACLM